jgi:hypothetical protein
MTLAGRPDSRRCLLLLAEVMRTPELAERLMDVLGLKDEEKGTDERKEAAGAAAPAEPGKQSAADERDGR